MIPYTLKSKKDKKTTFTKVLWSTRDAELHKVTYEKLTESIPNTIAENISVKRYACPHMNINDCSTYYLYVIEVLIENKDIVDEIVKTLNDCNYYL